MILKTSCGAITKRIRRAFIHLPHVDEALRRLTELFDEDWTGVDAEHIMILGETGTGKSTLLKHFAESHPRLRHAEFTEIPVLYVPVPPQCTIGKLAKAMLRALGSPTWNKGDESDLTVQVLTLLASCRVRLVILDEVNHLVDRGKATTHYAVGDWIKAVFSEAGMPCVLAGIPRTRSLLETNEQLGDRFAEIIEIAPLTLQGPKHVTARAALKAFQDLLDGVQCIELYSATTAKLFMFATAGRLRQIRRLLVRSVEIACRADTRKIDLDVLAVAFQEVVFPGGSADRNPFKKDFNGVPLTKDGEPFAPGAK